LHVSTRKQTPHITQEINMIARYCFLFLLLAAIPASAQKQSFRMNIDIAAFDYDGESSYVELYYSFSRAGISYAKDNGSYTGAIVVHSIIRRDDEEQEPVVKSWRVPVTLTDTSNLSDRTLIGRVNYLLEPGKYRFAVISRDETRPEVSDSVEIPFEVRNFAVKTPSISDIELASSIKKVEDDPTNIFFKNTLEVIPNPTLLYGKQVPNLMYYSEFYHLDIDPFVVKAEVVSSYGRTMSTKLHQRSGKHASRVEVGTINIGALPSGVYTLILAYGDTTKKIQALTEQGVLCVQPRRPVRQSRGCCRGRSDRKRVHRHGRGRAEREFQHGDVYRNKTGKGYLGFSLRIRTEAEVPHEILARPR
jgi:hypothetical protein